MKKSILLPFCYQFFFDKKNGRLILEIAKWALPELVQRLQGEDPLMQRLQSTYGDSNIVFADFGKSGQPFGWNQSVSWQAETAETVTYYYQLAETTYVDALLSFNPVIRFANDILKEYRWEKRRIQAEQSRLNRQQLLAIDWTDTEGMLKCSLNGCLADEVFEWVASFGNTHMWQVEKAMLAARNCTDSTESLTASISFLCYKPASDMVILEVPGNACNLSTVGNYGLLEGWGKTLTPHNVWKHSQQLYLLVGLATLIETFEKNEK